MSEGWTRAEATAQALVEAAKPRRLTPHHLRHTAAALLWAAGASDLEVRLILGHADVDISRRLYGHLLAGTGDEPPRPRRTITGGAPDQLTFRIGCRRFRRCRVTYSSKFDGEILVARPILT
jgi:hypothetical protein